MATNRDYLLRLLLESGRTPPSPSLGDVHMVSLKLVTASQRFDLRADIESRIRVVLPCRVVMGNLRAPKAFFVVMDDAVAVLGPVGWSGYLKPEPHALDVILQWSQVSTIGFRFPGPWGSLPAPSSKKFLFESGKELIVLTSGTGNTVRLIPESETRDDFPRIARFCAAVLDRCAPASRPAIRVPDLGDARSLPAFGAAMEELSFRYFENGSRPEILWPLMEQYLQPMLYRHPLRAHMTSDEVDGQWLIEKYVSYAGQSLCLLQHSNHHLQQGELAASDHAALRDFILDSTREMYGLVVCAIQNAGRERPTCFDGAPLEWDPELLAHLTSKLNEIVSAQDANDPIRLAQQMLNGDGEI